MGKERPYALSIAGFDPSGGAGVLADVKTFEANKVQGLAVVTANTFQNESEFESVGWIPVESIVKQTEVLLRKYSVKHAKIGLIRDLDTLDQLISHLTSPAAHLIWDPILRASAGFEFHSKIERDKLIAILKKIFLITPNTEEALALTGLNDPGEAAKELSAYCHVYLKGGHDVKNKGRDRLFTRDGKQFSFNPKRRDASAKHGSGCVLSAAITANLAKGFKLHGACLRAKEYTENVLASNRTLLAYHKL